MNANLTFQSIIETPQLIYDYAASKGVITFNYAMIDRFALADEAQRTGLVSIEKDLLCHKMKPAGVLDAVQQQIKLPEDKARELATLILTEFCGAIRWYFEGLSDAVAALGAQLPEGNAFAVAEPVTTVAAAIKDIMEPLDDMPPRFKPRLEEYLEKIIRSQQYDAAKIQQELSVPITEGGLGISEARMGIILNKLLEFLSVFRFTDVESGSPAVPPPPPAVSLRPQKHLTDIQIGSALEAHEAADVAAAAPAAQAAAASPLSEQQKGLAAAVLAVESLAGQPAELQDRWKSIVEARVKQVRDTAKTKELIASPVSAGGLGLSTAEAERLSQLLEDTARRFESRREEFSVLEKMASVQKSTAAIAGGPELKEKKDQAELNERFVKLFGKRDVEAMRAETHREIEAPQVAHPDEVGKTVVGAPASQQTAPKVPDKLRALIDAENPVFPLKSQIPKKPVTELGEKGGASAPAPMQPPKKSADIRPGARLVGPIDELRTMTLVDFRRLSPDPTVAIQKIRNKIEVIGQDGALEMLRAIQAFEQSEPVKLYRELLKQSLFAQKSVDDISAERKAAKQPYLDPQEAVTIKQFLSQIRYSSL